MIEIYNFWISASNDERGVGFSGITGGRPVGHPPVDLSRIYKVLKKNEAFVYLVLMMTCASG